MSEVRRGREQQVMITLLYPNQDDKQLSEHDIKCTLEKLIDVLNCRRDIAICERRSKPGKTGIYVKAYRE